MNTEQSAMPESWELMKWIWTSTELLVRDGNVRSSALIWEWVKRINLTLSWDGGNLSPDRESKWVMKMTFSGHEMIITWNLFAKLIDHESIAIQLANHPNFPPLPAQVSVFGFSSKKSRWQTAGWPRPNRNFRTPYTWPLGPERWSWPLSLEGCRLERVQQ